MLDRYLGEIHALSRDALENMRRVSHAMSVGAMDWREGQLELHKLSSKMTAYNEACDALCRTIDKH